MHIFASITTAIAITAFAPTALAQSTVRPVPRIPRPLDWNALSAAAAGPATGAAVKEHERLESLLPTEAKREIELEIFGTLLPAAVLETGAGEVETQRFGWSAKLIQELDGGAAVGFSVANEASFYDFSTTAPLIGGAGDPFNDVYETRLGATYYGPVGKHISYFHGLEFVIAGDPEAGIAKSTTLGLTSGLSYRAAERLEFTLGLMAFSRLEDDVVVMPYIGLDWRIADSVELVAEGNRVELEIELTDALELELFGRYGQRQFRLDAAGGFDDPAFRDEQIDIGANLAIGLGDGASLEFGVGYTAWRELTFLANGGTLSEVELDPKPYASVGLSFGL